MGKQEGGGGLKEIKVWCCRWGEVVAAVSIAGLFVGGDETEVGSVSGRGRLRAVRGGLPGVV